MNDRPYIISDIVEQTQFFIQFSVLENSIVFYTWNLVLLLIPFLLYKLLIGIYRKNNFKKTIDKILAILIGFFWILFIPNTPYLITEFRHIIDLCIPTTTSNVCVDTAWLIPILFLYSSLGWVAFVWQMNQMKNFIKIIKNKKVSNYFVFVSIPIISFGLILGLVGRFSSWEVFTATQEFEYFIISFFKTPMLIFTLIIYTIVLYILYFLGNFLINKKWII